MIEEITPPPVEWGASGRWFWLHALAYIAELIGGTALFGAVAGAIGSFVGTAAGAGRYHGWVATIAAISIAYGMHELDIVRLPMPRSRWQVPARWAKYGKGRQMLLYGAVLGSEVTTYIPYATFYVLVLLEATLGARGGATLSVLYGAARATPTLVALVHARHVLSAIPVTVRIMRAMRFFHLINGAMIVFAGGVLLVAILAPK